ncbi:FG-GAP repeat protein [Haloarcula amylovorans]|uniref:FG-GAP repeat protein n=1 Tax=Haloarcula amylovorans TaxID=2562280 RepID=UPI0014300F88|nr:FG-GAP repeat protein [Halomicroarcula amylolytica]
MSRRDTLRSAVGLGSLSLPTLGDGRGFFDRQSALETDSAGSGWQQEAKLVPPDPNSDFSYPLAVSGDTVIVGAPWERRERFASGTAYVFTRQNDEWVQEARLLPDPTKRQRDRFGRAVALDGDTAFVGSRSGVSVLARRDGEWAHQTILPDQTSNGNIGSPIALSGSTAVVGVGFTDRPQYRTGSVLVFTRRDGDWAFDASLRADEGDIFDGDIAVSGDTIVVGGRDENDEPTAPGSAYVFTREGGEWTKQAKLLAENGYVGDNFGQNVAVDGDVAFVGKPGRFQSRVISDEPLPGLPGRTRPGEVYVFTRKGGEWSQKQRLTADTEDTKGFFGASVEFDGEHAVVGRGPDGAAYVYDFRDGEWTQAAKLRPPDGGLSGLTVVSQGRVVTSAVRAVYVFSEDRCSDGAPEATIECGESRTESLGDDGRDAPDGTGFRGPSYYQDAFAFDGTQGARVVITMRRQDDSGDPYLILLGPDGNVVAENDDGGTGITACFSPQLPEDGEYTVVATSAASNQTFEYTLSVECRRP